MQYQSWRCYLGGIIGAVGGCRLTLFWLGNNLGITNIRVIDLFSVASIYGKEFTAVNLYFVT